MALERLQKILSRAGVASRRKAEEMITAGRVSVDGRKVTELGTKADPGRNRIKIDGKDLPRPPPCYLLFHKPTGVITTLSDPEGRESVADFLPPSVPRVYPIGRLDWDTQGVLLLTNDGELANRLMHPSRGVPKVYRVKVVGSPMGDVLKQLADGVDIEVDGKIVRTAPAHEVSMLQEKAGKTWIRLVIHEGKNRQIKRMFEAVGLTVLKLRRDAFAGVTPSGVPLGRLRALKPEEISHLRELAGLPAKPASRSGKGGSSAGGGANEPWTPKQTMRGGPYGAFGGQRPQRQTRRSSGSGRGTTGRSRAPSRGPDKSR